MSIEPCLGVARPHAEELTDFATSAEVAMADGGDVPVLL